MKFASKSRGLDDALHESCSMIISTIRVYARKRTHWVAHTPDRDGHACRLRKAGLDHRDVVVGGSVDDVQFLNSCQRMCRASKLIATYQ